MTLPWWLAHFDPAALLEVLALFAGGDRFELGGRLARIAEALLRNRYASGAVDITRVRGALHVSVESGLLLEMGNTLLRMLRSSKIAPISTTGSGSPG